MFCWASDARGSHQRCLMFFIKSALLQMELKRVPTVSGSCRLSYGMRLKTDIDLIWDGSFKGVLEFLSTLSTMVRVADLKIVTRNLITVSFFIPGPDKDTYMISTTDVDILITGDTSKPTDLEGGGAFNDKLREYAEHHHLLSEIPLRMDLVDWINKLYDEIAANASWFIHPMGLIGSLLPKAFTTPLLAVIAKLAHESFDVKNPNEAMQCFTLAVSWFMGKFLGGKFRYPYLDAQWLKMFTSSKMAEVGLNADDFISSFLSVPQRSRLIEAMLCPANPVMWNGEFLMNHEDATKFFKDATPVQFEERDGKIVFGNSHPFLVRQTLAFYIAASRLHTAVKMYENIKYPKDMLLFALRNTGNFPKIRDYLSGKESRLNRRDLDELQRTFRLKPASSCTHHAGPSLMRE